MASNKNAACEWELSCVLRVRANFNFLLGTYHKNLHIMSTVILKTTSRAPTFKWDGFLYKLKRPYPSCSKAPNLYYSKESHSYETTLGKTVSLKGLYQLFTGPRDDSTIKNHFTPPLKCILMTSIIPLQVRWISYYTIPLRRGDAK